MKLLHVDSSIQGAASVSRTVSAAVVARLRAQISDLTVIERDLVAAPLAHLTLDAFGGAEAKAMLEEFQAADIVVIGAGLYNFTIPSQLKAWIDRIVIAGQTFRYGANGPEGLTGGKRIIVVLGRGGVYSDGAPAAAYEHGETLLRTLFGFIGAAPEFITVEGVALGDEARQAALAAGLEKAGQLTA